MDNNEILEVNQTSENVEVTTEETPVKTYTQEEVDAMMGKRVARTEAKIRKEYDRKYGRLETVLRDGLGKESIEEITDDLDNFYYKQKGIKRTQKPEYSQKDIEYLANRDAEGIISAGFEDVIDETERLQKLGDQRNAREEAMYKALSKHLKTVEKNQKYADLGVTEDVYTSAQFQDFAKKFNSDTPAEEVYDLYKAKYPKEQPKTLGSMKNTNSGDSGVKEYYSPDEARRFTKKDYDRNPALFAAVERSMLKWRK